MSLMDLLRRRKTRSFSNEMGSPLGEMRAPRVDLMAPEDEDPAPLDAQQLTTLAELLHGASMDTPERPAPRPSVRTAVLTKPGPDRFALTDEEKALTSRGPAPILRTPSAGTSKPLNVPIRTRMSAGAPRRSSLDDLYGQMARSRGGSVLSQPLDKKRLGGLRAANSLVELLGLVGAGAATQGALGLAAPLADAGLPASARVFEAMRTPQALAQLQRAQDFFLRYKDVLNNPSLNPQTVARWQGSRPVQDALQRAMEISAQFK